MFDTTRTYGNWSSSMTAHFPNEQPTTTDSYTTGNQDLVTTISVAHNDTTDSAYENQYSRTVIKKLYGFIYTMVFCLVAVSLNTFALVALSKTSRMGKTSSDIFLMSQSCFDLASSSVVFFYVIGLALLPPDLGDSFGMHVVCSLFYSRFFNTLFANLSIFNCTLLTLERYAKIGHPIMHKIWMTPSKAKSILITVICFSVCHSGVLCIMPTGLIAGRCSTRSFLSDNAKLGLFGFNFVIETAIPIAAFLVCYSHMLYILHKRKFGLKLQVLNKPCTRSEGSATLFHDSQHGVHLSGPSTSISDASLNIESSSQVSSFDTSTASSSIYTTSKNSNDVVKPKQKKTTHQILGKAERNLFLTALLVNISFIASNAPLRFYSLFLYSGIIKTDIAGPVVKFMYVIIYMNYCIHPLIYTFSLKRIRDKFCFWKRRF